MGRMRQFFSLKGRSSRREWWIVEILALVGLRMNEVAFDLLLHRDGCDLGHQTNQLWLMVMAGLLWVMHASNVRRLHDRGKSGWWSLVFLIPGIGQLWCIVECGFMEGQPQPNRNGPPAGARTVYQTLAGRMTARLQALTHAAATPSQAPKEAKPAAPVTLRAQPATPAAKATRRVSVLASSQRPTVQRGGGGLPMPRIRQLRVAIAAAALLLGLGAMALTGGIPIPNGFVPVGDNSYTGVFRSGGQGEQP
jgi:uncharacterized membrane protein YhaH (DUF805 family)